VAVFGGYTGKYNMSKFLALCEKVEAFLKEAGEVPPAPVDPNAAPAPEAGLTDATPANAGPETPPPPSSDPTHIVTNDQIVNMVKFLADYLEKNLGNSDPLKEKLSSLGKIDPNKDDDIKRVVQALSGIVDPNQENSEVPVEDTNAPASGGEYPSS
jgi:hypothetical protein